MDMESGTYLNLYIGNHGKPDGIEDYIVLLTDLMAKRGIRVAVSSALDPDAVNLVIDEFTNYIENHRMAAFKKAHPQSKIVFVLTEFIVRKWGVESFNNFGGPIEAAVISLFDVYLRLVRDDLGPIAASSVLRLLCYSPLLALRQLPGSLLYVLRALAGRRARGGVTRFLQDNHRTIYFHMRYLGLKAFLRYADAIITSHERVIDGVTRDASADGKPLRFFGVLYPELDERDVVENLMVDKELFMEITGSVTRHRQKWIWRINRQLTSLGLHNVFGACVALPFAVLASGKPVDRGAYSLHPPQTRAWPFSSPTRIFRALSVDRNLPVLTHHFHQNPIEDVCFVFENKTSIVELYEMYVDPARLRKFIEPRIRSYNEFVIARNDALAEQLRGLMGTLDQLPSAGDPLSPAG
jgi:hypothetical protein